MKMNIDRTREHVKRIARPIIEGEYEIATPWDVVDDQRNLKSHLVISGKNPINAQLDTRRSDAEIASDIRALLVGRPG